MLFVCLRCGRLSPRRTHTCNNTRDSTQIINLPETPDEKRYRTHPKPTVSQRPKQKQRNDKNTNNANVYPSPDSSVAEFRFIVCPAFVGTRKQRVWLYPGKRKIIGVYIHVEHRSRAYVSSLREQSQIFFPRADTSPRADNYNYINFDDFAVHFPAPHHFPPVFMQPCVFLWDHGMGEGS